MLQNENPVVANLLKKKQTKKPTIFESLILNLRIASNKNKKSPSRIQKIIVSERNVQNIKLYLIIRKKRQMTIQHWLNRFDPTLLMYSCSGLSTILHKIIRRNERFNNCGK